MRVIHLLPAIFVHVLIVAQDTPTIDLTMSDNGRGQIEVRARSSGYFDGCLAAASFTLRWPASAGVALDTAVRCYPFQDVLPMSATQPVTSGQYMYRTFNGFGITLLSDFDLSWQAGREYPICTADILVPGTTIELVNDAFTTANNRDFFVSLGGIESTGIYYTLPRPQVNIHTADPGTGSVDIVLTPEGDFFGWATALDFTLRWPANAGVTLGSPTQDAEVAEYILIDKVGDEVTDGGFTYQRFHGEGSKSIANSDDSWAMANEVIALSVPVFGQSPDIMVVNDEWTSAHEGNYSILLDGVPRSGQVEDMATSVSAVDAPVLSAQLVPTANGYLLSANLPGSSGMATFALHNAAGQSVWSTSLERATGRVQFELPTSGMPHGMYILSVTHGSRALTKRLVR